MNYLQPNTILQGGKYRIERVLGQGNFGIAYLAQQFNPNRTVAIKELFLSIRGINDRNGNSVIVPNNRNKQMFEQQIKKFKKEALRLTTLRHNNIVKVYDTFEENGTVYYVMDFIEGESLRDKLNREGALPESLVMKYFQQLLSALQVVHEKSIWHLDIKPENILVDYNDQVYLTDFGASKHIEQSNGTLTTSSMLVGSPGYYPPEQSVETMKNIGAWTDIYALGATLYNLLTRHNPPTFDVIISEGRNAFSFPFSISSKTQDMIVRMMKVNRNERPQSVQDIIDNSGKTKVEKQKFHSEPEVDKHGFKDSLVKESNENYTHLVDNKNEESYRSDAWKIEEDCSPYWASFICPIVFMACWFIYLYSEGSDLGIILLSLFVGLPVSFLISRFLYNSIKKSRIEKWKTEHPDDPRNKYLHFSKDV